MYLSELAGEVYLNVLISGAIALPTCIGAYFVLKLIGRKPAFIGSYLIGAFFSLLSVPFDIIEGKRNIYTIAHGFM